MGLKPGYKTTEFLISCATTLGLVLAASANWLPSHYAALGAAISAGAYSLARGLAKLNPPKDAGTPPPS